MASDKYNSPEVRDQCQEALTAAIYNGDLSPDVTSPGPSLGDCRFSSKRPLDTAPEKTGPTRGERVSRVLLQEPKPFTPSSRVLFAAYRGARLFIDSPLERRGDFQVFPLLSKEGARGRSSPSCPCGHSLPGICSKGFTLLEVLVALGLFVLALGSLPGVLIESSQSNEYARHLTTAANFGQDKIEAIRNMTYTNVTSGTDQTTEGVTTFTRSWTVSSGPTATTRKVVVLVSWTDKANRQVELDAIIGG